MFYNGSRRAKQANFNVLTHQLLSPQHEAEIVLDEEQRVPTMDDKEMNIESNYDEYSRSIYASDNSYLRNHRQEKCSTEKFTTFTQQTSARPAIATCRSPAKTLAKHIFLLLVLQTICNRFVTNVICDESSEARDANGHYTHTWVVHIPGGEAVADEVAAHHSMKVMGKVSWKCEKSNSVTYSCSFPCSHTRERYYKLILLPRNSC